MSAIVWIKADIAVGTAIYDAASALVEMANKTGFGIESEFNGVTVLAKPGDTPANVAAIYEKIWLRESDKQAKPQAERGCDDKPKQAQEQLCVCPTHHENCPVECYHRTPHAKDEGCDALSLCQKKCIPYAQEQGGDDKPVSRVDHDDCSDCANESCSWANNNMRCTSFEPKSAVIDDYRARLDDEKKSCLDFAKGVEKMAKALDYIKGICDRGGYEGTDKEKEFVDLRILGYVKKLESRLSEACSGWKPIETAPKDGTPILLYAKGFVDEDFNTSGVIEGYWQDGDGWRGAIWESENDEWSNVIVGPTHWQYKPTAPKYCDSCASHSEADSCSKWAHSCPANGFNQWESKQQKQTRLEAENAELKRSLRDAETMMNKWEKAR